ncbi:MAG: hypothetical protein A2583_06610 [Bdellovibrionales bacterium RIFOXYD1_FULL_53_11]|nr:MAG: hypothetical protein A2583_06610 [Bdellovibrionales bacterium RIFOXYD1_FULL_53_11]
MMNAAAFFLFGGFGLAFSAMAAFGRNMVGCAFSLVMAFFCFAGVYAALGAHLVAVLQIFVYAGAVMVLFVFVIMIIGSRRMTGAGAGQGRFVTGAGVLAAGAALVLLIKVFRGSAVGTGRVSGPFTADAVAAAGGNTRVLSELLFSEYALPFELVTAVLVAAAVCAVTLLIPKRERSGS